MSVQRVLLVACSVLLIATTGWAGSQPVAVSPGTASGALIGDACPTFSWGAVAEAKSYELVVYRVGEEHEEAEPVLRQSFAGSANGWTPSLGQCLEPGQRYAWSIRAQGEWSEASLFEVSCSIEVGELQPPVRRGLENRELMRRARFSRSSSRRL